MEKAPDLTETRTAPGMLAAGGLLGAIVASSCCILPLVLFSLGISGAWIGNLTALAPYQPVFAVVTLGLLGYGHYLVYWKPRRCAEGDACARQLPDRAVKVALWSATMLIAAALVFPYAAPALLGI
nr:mercuric transporter MerT family protein [Pseudohoeflea sp. DP4N28-3]